MAKFNNAARIVSDFPFKVRTIEHLWITMPDGIRLSARVWLPEEAERNPVPAVLEYLPYRKRDGTRSRDEARHTWLAGHGYAAIRLDIRGTGESEGQITDEYSAQELSDGRDAIAWIAAQPWCSGNVGMTGISWGGFNSLQIAALRPPALKAIITHCSTDDRYADDVHFMGGAIPLDNWFWGAAFFEFMSMPPDPAIAGEDWLPRWLERMEKWEPVAASQWLRHQRRDAFWKHGSICENYADIQCAVYAVGGWEDGYSNAVPRLLQNLKVPRKGLIGPWGHKYPQDGIPGPAIGFLQESLRWWDHWLKGIDTGIMQEPLYQAWMGQASEPKATLAMAKGRWIAEASWPSKRLIERRINLLSAGDPPKSVKPLQTVGSAGGVWCPYGLGGSSPDLAIDQNEDDARSLTFESSPLLAPLEYFGQARVRLTLSVDQPQAFIALRLVDVSPDGTATRVTYQVLNLTHRKGHETLSSIPVNQAFELDVALNDIAWSFSAGHRLRVAISTAYWPVIWPSPRPVRLTVMACELALPERPANAADAEIAFQEPISAPTGPVTVLTPGRASRIVTRDLATGLWTTEQVEDHGAWRIEEIDLHVEESILATFQIAEDDPLSASAQWDVRSRRKRKDWDVSIASTMKVRATLADFIVETDLRALSSGKQVFFREWSHKVPRDGV